jgi:hypothetical protein
MEQVRAELRDDRSWDNEPSPLLAFTGISDGATIPYILLPAILDQLFVYGSQRGAFWIGVSEGEGNGLSTLSLPT